MKKYAIINGNIITGKADGEIVVGKSIVVEDGTIVDITSDEKVLEGLKKIDVKGKFIIPGLINLHVHLPGSGMPKDTKKQNKKTVDFLMRHRLTKYIVYKLCAAYAKTELMSGVTTIRTVGGVSDIDSVIRDKSAAGKIVAPRVIASNMAISVPGGHMAGILAYEATSPEDGRRLVRTIAETRPDLIKLMITGGILDAKKECEPGILRMSPDIVDACVEEAHGLGYKVAAHVESAEGVTVALRGGVDTIEHGGKIGEEEIELFKKNGSAHVLTISPVIPMAFFDPNKSGGTELQCINSKVVFDGMIQCAKTCLDNGIPVGLGTDTACPYVTQYDTWREAVYFKKFLGASNAQALRAITLGNAEIAGISSVTGSIEVGKCADMVVLSGNPLEDLTCLRCPDKIIARGRVINNPKIKKFDYVEEELDKYI